MKRILLIALALMLSSSALYAQVGHEYAPLLEKEITYKDFTYKNIRDEKPVDLREFATGKKLVLVVYFAPWCPNWRNEAPVATKLYEKYKANGLDVIGVGEYASRDDVKNYFGPAGPAFTIVTESDSRDAREKTPHYAYRQKTGDTRKWGSPYNVFLTPANLTPQGEVLTEKTWVVNGELIEADVEKFIREQLGLKEEPKQQAATPK
jgi:thiol-disulfide isomerase/thioredoxin